MINIEKFRSRSTKDEPIEVREPVTKDDIVAEVWVCYTCLITLFCGDNTSVALPLVLFQNPLDLSVVFIRLEEKLCRLEAM